ncbi:MAG: delta-60 repeat domain-containing protein, partial [Haloferula sp.]
MALLFCCGWTVTTASASIIVDEEFDAELARDVATKDANFFVQPDGKIILWGDFTQALGESAAGVVRLLPNGT